MVTFQVRKKPEGTGMVAAVPACWLPPSVASPFSHRKRCFRPPSYPGFLPGWSTQLRPAHLILLPPQKVAGMCPWLSSFLSLSLPAQNVGVTILDYGTDAPMVEQQENESWALSLQINYLDISQHTRQKQNKTTLKRESCTNKTGTQFLKVYVSIYESSHMGKHFLG